VHFRISSQAGILEPIVTDQVGQCRDSQLTYKPDRTNDKAKRFKINYYMKNTKSPRPAPISLMQKSVVPP